HLITGVAGFIGSQLADALLASGEAVLGVDDFSLGSPRNLACAQRRAAFRFVEADIADVGAATGAFTQLCADGAPDILWHLAANSDISAGVADPRVDFRRTRCTT